MVKWGNEPFEVLGYGYAGKKVDLTGPGVYLWTTGDRDPANGADLLFVGETEDMGPVLRGEGHPAFRCVRKLGMTKLLIARLTSTQARRKLVHTLLSTHRCPCNRAR